MLLSWMAAGHVTLISLYLPNLKLGNQTRVEGYKGTNRLSGCEKETACSCLLGSRDITRHDPFPKYRLSRFLTHETEGRIGEWTAAVEVNTVVQDMANIEMPLTIYTCTAAYACSQMEYSGC